MIIIRKSDQRGHFNFGWLDTQHTFSFGDYFDKNQMGFRSLRVINEDVVAPGQGFGRHPHQDMEIITYVLSGALAHQDWVNGKPTHAQSLTPGEVQHMSAGYGIEHSEFNASKTDPVHLLQIWIRPGNKGHKPTYDQKRFDALTPGASSDKLTLVASPDGAGGSIAVNADAKLYVARPGAGQKLDLPLEAGRHAWIQVTRGNLSVNGNKLAAGDGAAVSDETSLKLESADDTEALVFDLA